MKQKCQTQEERLQCPSLTSPSTGTCSPHSLSQCPSLTSPFTGTCSSSFSQPVSQPNITIYRDLFLLILSASVQHLQRQGYQQPWTRARQPKDQFLKPHDPDISQSISHLQDHKSRQFFTTLDQRVCLSTSTWSKHKPELIFQPSTSVSLNSIYK
ncbi:hypothetical protein WMY93_022169 [Mugilogobius chulae]|uniref:Uncharacterized protein n=1 Tax=Mugilogobius chulae TaxID=88201 RepID=A0AAW0NNV0_9GOBI